MLNPIFHHKGGDFLAFSFYRLMNKLKNIMNNIKIREIEVYHGSRIVDNSYYIEHFKKLGKDIKHFLEDVTGRKKRYLLADKNENSLTMAINASKKVLQKSNLNGDAIDMIIYSSVLPEFVSPPSSIIIHNHIKGKSSCFCHDMNVNCAGMIYALDLAGRYMSSNNHVNKVLIVGSDYLTPQTDPDNELCNGQYGDAACAIILEKTSGDSKLIDTKVTVDSSAMDNIVFPRCGFSNMYDAHKEDLWAKWVPFKASWLDSAIENINLLLSENNLTISDISHFCLSQFCYSNIEYIREHLNISPDKSIFVGDTYGYTGTSSPFIVFYEALKQGKIKRGDYVILWTVGAGTLHIASLIKY